MPSLIQSLAGADPGGASIPEAAGLTALLTLARSGASDGDVYKDSVSGMEFTYRAVGSGILLPTAWADKVGGLMTNDPAAADPCYITLADATADLTGRGWLLNNLTKTADAALVIADVGPGSCYIISSTTDFGPPGSSTFTGADSLYVIGKIKCTATGGGLYGQSRCIGCYNQTGVGTGNSVIFAYGTSTLGVIESANASLGIQSSSSSTMTTGADVAWVQWYFPPGVGAATMSMVTDGTAQLDGLCTQPYSTMWSSGGGHRLDPGISSGGNEAFELYEFFAFEVA